MHWLHSNWAIKKKNKKNKKKKQKEIEVLSIEKENFENKNEKNINIAEPEAEDLVEDLTTVRLDDVLENLENPVQTTTSGKKVKVDIDVYAHNGIIFLFFKINLFLILCGKYDHMFLFGEILKKEHVTPKY